MTRTYMTSRGRRIKIRHRRKYKRPLPMGSPLRKYRSIGWKQIKGVGKRCVVVLANGQWRFARSQNCGKR